MRPPASYYARQYSSSTCSVLLCFPTLGRGPVQNRACVYLEGCSTKESSIPMLGGVIFFLSFSCSVALSLSTFSTPPLPECLFCYWGDGLAFSCSVAFAFLFASDARWRCDFQRLQPLYSANACFVNWATDLQSRAWWRSLYFVLLMLGGVAIFNFCNPSTARMLVLLVERQICILMLGGACFFVFSC